MFGRKNAFHDFLNKYTDLGLMRKALIDLFKILDTPLKERDPYLEDELNQFPYVNGGLFSNENIEIPSFTEEIRDILLAKAADDFDWSEISPTIFGAVFESTLNHETRRSGGMHYTSIENIHKVIDPLFLDELRIKLNEAEAYKSEKTRNDALRKFQEYIGSLTFFDPACGSGNFLTETYLSLRRLENEAIETISHGQMMLDVEDIIKVSIDQFYGIEINDFAVTVAKTALWIAESQMLKKTEEIIHMNIDFLPLKTYDNIYEGNALTVDWNEIVSSDKCNYCYGNPPFVGARLMSTSQKNDVFSIFNGWKNIGNLDYVACWYKKAADYMLNTSIKTALVSTNSISQGSQVSILWTPLFEKGIKINFAYRTFRWDSEANIKAHVHCVIIGFSYCDNEEKYIFDNDIKNKVNIINGYLIAAPTIAVESRNKPLCDIPKIGIGNQPIDGGYYLFNKNEMEEFIKKEPLSKNYFMRWYGGEEFINNTERYCLYLGKCTPEMLRKMPLCMERVKLVRQFRLSSKRESTLKLANTPTKFQTENIPDSNYIVIPETSSEKRRYIPIGFMGPNVLCSNATKIVSNADLYHFGILTSNVHMSWMRAVGGRLEMRYKYSKDIVYNNFPWPNSTEEQKNKIKITAQMILEAREKYPNSSLADLYDDLAMPPELRKAHQLNDIAVWEAYGKKWDKKSESDCVAWLMKLYEEKIKEIEEK